MDQLKTFFPRLLGDVGGTNVRWAWQAQADGALEHVSAAPCDASASLTDSARAYLSAHALTAPQSACLGVATAIDGDLVQLTNSQWSFSIEAFRLALQLERCLVINDFTALALSLPALGGKDLHAVGGGRAVPGCPVALIGPGTGLGVSGLVPNTHGAPTAISGEGGHVTLAPTDDLEADIIANLRLRFGHASAERALSGPGLVNLHTALAQVEGIAAQPLTAREITAAARSGSDRLSEGAVRLFVSLLGNVSGNLALTLGARGGVFLGGGILTQLGTLFDHALFRRKFEDKGRFSGYLGDIPVWLIVADNPALLGAARALDAT